MLFQERILQTLEQRDDVDQRKLARIAGINESTISRYINGYDELNFEYVLKIVKYLYPVNEKEIMSGYVLTQKSQNARYALEYCDMSRLDEITDRLIERLLSSNNPVDKEWAHMYHILRLRGNITHQDLLDQLDSFIPKSIHMQVLKRIVKGYGYFDLNDHHSLSVHIKGTEELIEKIKSKFIQKCYYIRLGSIMQNVYLYRNDIEQARYYSTLAVDQDFFENKKGIAYHNLGHSYMFEDYNEAKKYLELGIQIFREHNQEKFLNIAMLNLSFLQSYWQIEREFTLKLDDYQNFANFIYYLIQKGNILEASEYMSQIDIDSLSAWDKAFFYYYQGLINQDKNSFYYSVYWFRKIGDFYHHQLPLQALRSLGENELILKIFAS